MSTVALVGACAGTVSVLGAWPQLIRLGRGRTSAGVSSTAALLQLVATVGWLTYGSLIADGTQVVTNLLCLIPVLGVVIHLTRETRTVLPHLAVGTGWAAALGIGGYLGGSGLVGALCFTLALFVRLPQLREVLVSRVLVGLSPASSALATLASLLWSVYGLLHHDTAVLAASTFALSVNSVVLLRRCPPRQVLLAAVAGRFGRAPAYAVRPLVALVGAGPTVRNAVPARAPRLPRPRTRNVEVLATGARTGLAQSLSRSGVRRPPSQRQARPAPATGPPPARSRRRSARR